MSEAEYINKLCDYRLELTDVCRDMREDWPDDHRVDEVCRRVITGIDAITEMIETGKEGA
jgi:hypothetical protein